MRNDWIETLARASAGLPESRGPDPLALIDPQGGGQLILPFPRRKSGFSRDQLALLDLALARLNAVDILGAGIWWLAPGGPIAAGKVDDMVAPEAARLRCGHAAVTGMSVVTMPGPRGRPSRGRRPLQHSRRLQPVQRPHQEAALRHRRAATIELEAAAALGDGASRWALAVLGGVTEPVDPASMISPPWQRFSASNAKETDQRCGW
jgi:hypothetical protein